MEEVQNIEELCQSLDFKTSGTCMEWMQEAVKHCTKIMKDPKTQDSNLWTAMRSAFSSERNNEQINTGIQVGINNNIEINPNDLTLDDCGNIITTISDDYFKNLPNALLFEICYGLIIAGLSGLLIFIYLYLKNKFYTHQQQQQQQQHPQKVKIGETTAIQQKLSQQSMTSNESSEQLDYETAPTSKTIVVKVNRLSENNEYDEFLPENGYHQYDLTENGQEMPFQRATLERILDFIEDYAKEMRVVVLIDDNRVYQEMFDPSLKFRSEKYEESLHLKCVRSKSALSATSSSGNVRSRIPVSNQRKAF